MPGSLHGGSQAGPHSQGLSQPGEGQPGAQGHFCGGSDRPRPSRAHVWARFSGVHGWAALCCVELESSPAAASYGKEVVALGLIWASVPPAGLGSPRSGQRQADL